MHFARRPEALSVKVDQSRRKRLRLIWIDRVPTMANGHRTTTARIGSFDKGLCVMCEADGPSKMHHHFVP
jgi:hypothetical protein